MARRSWGEHSVRSGVSASWAFIVRRRAPSSLTRSVTLASVLRPSVGSAVVGTQPRSASCLMQVETRLWAMSVRVTISLIELWP